MLVLFSCASVKEPQGGPLDSDPPKLKSTTPAILTNLNQGQKITLSFNEFIKEESLKNAIELFPTVNQKIDFEYYGKEVIITLPSNLDDDKTYVISLNSNLSDEQNVKLNDNIIIPISLSNSINQAAIKGKIFGLYSKPSILLWKGIIDKSELPSRKPDYIISSNDKFSFGFLAYDKYTVLAVDLYNPKLSLEKNKLSFFSENFIELTKDNTPDLNFFFNAEEVEVELDSLNVTEDIEQFANIVGNINGNYILPVVVELRNEDNSFKTELSFDGKFKIDNVNSGTYQLFAYQDRNNNKILNTGNLQDDSNSEKFYVYPDSLILRANWELEIEDWEIN
ncbi:Ig-like domain-containing domain [Candidatus Marinimicrobia bacterium]|nr:Ig-like domain-containing domain [Candidatus Neomarinimicrobiota bacterium]